MPDAGGIVVAAAKRVSVDAESRAGILMPHAAGNSYRVDAVGKQRAGVRVPLRYNYDKPEKPRISRVFGYLARFFILFQNEKSSREVVIS